MDRSGYLYHQKCTFFFSGIPLVRTPQLSVLACEQSYDGWPPGKFLRQRVSEDKARQKGF